jgi:hypothetical protein
LLEKFDWNPKDAESSFQASKGLEQALRYFKETDANRVADLKNKLENYFYNLDQLRLHDDLFENTQERSSFFRVALGHLMYLILGFPIWLYGFLNNYLPYTLPSRLAYLITKEEGYIAPIMMFIGTLTFPIFYGLQIWAVQEYIGIGWLTILYALTLPITGFFTLAYWLNVQNTKDQWTLFSKFYKTGSMVAKVIRQRTEIVAVLDAAKLEYLAVLETEEERYGIILG